MKTANELFPKFRNPKWNYATYEPIVKNMGEIVIESRDDDWQGDSRILYKDGTTYGFLRFGWGSCSGCDALLACKTIEEVQFLMDDLLSRILWFDSKKAALKFFKEHNWKMDHDGSKLELKKFVKDSLKYLSSI